MANSGWLRSVAVQEADLFPQERTSNFATSIDAEALPEEASLVFGDADHAAAGSDTDRDQSLPDDSLPASATTQAPCVNCSRIEWCDVVDLVRSDHRNFYSRPILTRLGWGLLAAGIVANTQLDRELYEAYHDTMAVGGVGGYTEDVRPLGDGMLTLPVFAAAALFGRYATQVSGSELVGDWGSRSLRTVGVGCVPLIVLQRLTGAGRPDNPNGSAWTPFRFENGVSGHAFMGAIPFITAAKMSDEPLVKTVLYAGSTVTAWSRLQDERHYVSQIALGWWIAYLAATAIDQTEIESRNFTITPAPMADGAGLFFEWRR
jgi:membrane-associated phospholipid phosphatase